jgi:adenylate cyclase
MGIACGEMVAGSVGSQEHMEYTVIGDTVNTAARLEALTKRLGVDILVSDPVYQSVRGDVEAEAMPLVTLRGKSMPVQTYALRWMCEPGT